MPLMRLLVTRLRLAHLPVTLVTKTAQTVPSLLVAPLPMTAQTETAQQVTPLTKTGLRVGLLRVQPLLALALLLMPPTGGGGA